jgi:hypothetical protein
MNPRNRPIFGMPEIRDRNIKSVSSNAQLQPVRTISVSEFKFDSTKLNLIPSLGVGGVSLSWIKFNSPGYSEEEIDSAPSASIKLKLPKGRRTIELICVPTHAVYNGRALRTAIRLADSPPAIVDVDTRQGQKRGAKMLSGVIYLQEQYSFLKRR